MVVLHIFNVGIAEETPLSVLNTGEHVLGRGSFSNCIDRKISRRHAIINVQEEQVTLTAVHINPCFFISHTTNSVQVISKDETIQLSNNDQFAFVAAHWYRIQIVEDPSEIDLNINSCTTIPISVKDSSETVISSASTSASPLKRNLEELPSAGRKKLKAINQSLDDLIKNVEDIQKQDSGVGQDQSKDGNVTSGDGNFTGSDGNVNGGDETAQVYINRAVSDSDSDSDVDMTPEVTKDSVVVHTVASKPKSYTEQKSDSDEENKTGAKGSSDAMKDIKQQPLIQTEPSSSHIKTEEPQPGPNDDLNSPERDNEESLNQPNQGDANTSATSMGDGTKIRREQCWYGGNCYRKNPSHKSEFSHPGDSDHDSSSQGDNKPDCPYGAQCYRKNARHRTQYKHPAGDPTTKQAGRAKRKRKNIAHTDPSSESEEDDEEPFYDDESSSENFDDDGGDTSSNFGESQESYNQEEEDMKAMFKEAKKFLKK